MDRPQIAIVHNNINQDSSIGKLAAWAVRVALEADYRVIAVAKDLDAGLRGWVDHRPLHVPRAVFAYQWSQARRTVQAALGNTTFDLLHTYQPQLTPIADTWHVCYLTRPGLKATPQPQGLDARGWVTRVQQMAVAAMEDRILSRVPATVKVLFPSELMANEFSSLYGVPQHWGYLANPAPNPTPVMPAARSAARRELVGDFDGVVVGFLGGVDERKGWRSLLDGVAQAGDTFLIFGGTGSERIRDDRIGARMRTVGYVSDLAQFYCACDVLAVPSLFDPYAMVVTEAASYGVPSVVTPMVGVRSELLAAGAGVSWDGQADSFGAAVVPFRAHLQEYRRAAVRFAESVSEQALSAALLDEWQAAMERSPRGAAPVKRPVRYIRG